MVDPCGKQVGDFCASKGADLGEHLSAMHIGILANRSSNQPGESFHTNHRRLIPQPAQDTCGVYELLTASCEQHRYRLNGRLDGHPSGSDNYIEVMTPFLGEARCVPQPVNLFMNVAVLPDGRVETGENPSTPSEYAVVNAWIDGVAARSRFPQQCKPVAGRYPTDLHVGIYKAA
jgi:uncharacterized protein